MPQSTSSLARDLRGEVRSQRALVVMSSSDPARQRDAPDYGGPKVLAALCDVGKVGNRITARKGEIAGLCTMYVRIHRYHRHAVRAVSSYDKREC